MNEIEILNNWLEKNALGWEKTIQEDPSLKGSNWPEYFRSLKDLDKQTSFTISSALSVRNNPLVEYINSHKDEYIFSGATGYCLVTKINASSKSHAPDS